jgi:hypothetical protein
VFDFTIDCKACQAKLTAAQGDLTDERQKTTSLTRERDDALRIARGGSVRRRIGRAATWFPHRRRSRPRCHQNRSLEGAFAHPAVS